MLSQIFVLQASQFFSCDKKFFFFNKSHFLTHDFHDTSFYPRHPLKIFNEFLFEMKCHVLQYKKLQINILRLKMINGKLKSKQTEITINVGNDFDFLCLKTKMVKV